MLIHVIHALEHILATICINNMSLFVELQFGKLLAKTIFFKKKNYVDIF